MTYAVVFVPLLAAWAILHRAASKRSWGFVGGNLVFRETMRSVSLANKEIIAALRRLTTALTAAAASARIAAARRQL